jgi:hypothetical protein
MVLIVLLDDVCSSQRALGGTGERRSIHMRDMVRQRWRGPRVVPRPFPRRPGERLDCRAALK